MEYYSHIQTEDGEIIFKRFLKDHLKDVADVLVEGVESLYKDKVIQDIGYIIGIGHDFGKYTTYFQNYLLTGETSSNLHRHGFISAVFTAYLVEKAVEGLRGGYYKYLPLISYFCVLHHHGDLYSFNADVIKKSDLDDPDFKCVGERMRDKLLIMKEQLKDIVKNKEAIEVEYAEIFKNVQLQEFCYSWIDVLKEIDKERYFLFKKEDDATKSFLYELLLFYYSSLIDGDKRNAARVSVIERKYIPADLVDSYRKKKFDTIATDGMNGMRNEIYDKVTDKIMHVSLDNHLFTLTAPTGMGKTLTSLSAALKLRERVKKEKGIMPRVIYSLPFTSIIDQNFNVIEDVLSQLEDFESNRSQYLIKHHHLAETVYKLGDEEKPVDESLLLVESWESEIIVTTFVQLIHTLFGYKNRFLKKFHNIAGSIILLDEVQNIPIEYWPAVNEVLNRISTHLGCYIILLTATKPLIFREGEAIELLDDNRKYFEALDRVKLIHDLRPLTLEGFADEFLKIYDGQKSYLIVLNTIRSSLEFYGLIKERLNGENRDFYYLSTNIIPKERKRRVDEIRNALRTGKKIVVVSTQVVEAGVDIDLDVVLRDLGPIDSIIQVAGRCNRSNLRGRGEVYVFNLQDKRSYSSMIYGVLSTTISKEILKEETDESRFYDMINEYFYKVRDKKDLSQSDNLIDAMRNFCFDDNENVECNKLSNFQLIKENMNYVDVFVETDEDSVKIWEEYEEGILHERDFVKRQQNYLKMRKNFRDHIISVPLKLARDLIRPTKTSSILLIPLENKEFYYDDETGFKRDIDDEVLIF
ncbi:CRISPR-associated helicase, Cas3 family [Caldanaerobius fijiensis DSM 17918]|uniref:CRISPR-associated helicase, Cas3 family n=1 Tax=Caldanaerobius fijiensis DSM 17918 TaxID=1121256 RepID=A0A1M5B8M2_9THEO|nr:CRISPR-associated helicase/endonuclease Cas3 [Caldanaerobius fijiensis]SHF38785.1 CRISPR-associated helicase, Cas3 family [Caldanaerobius fijiensis DSM 17918]